MQHQVTVKATFRIETSMDGIYKEDLIENEMIIPVRNIREKNWKASAMKKGKLMNLTFFRDAVINKSSSKNKV